MTFNEVQDLVYKRFIAAWATDNGLEYALGNQPYEPPEEGETWGYFQVVDDDSELSSFGGDAQVGGTREYKRACVAELEIKVQVTKGDQAMNDLTDLFRTTFEGVSFSGIDFVEAADVGRPERDDRWTTKICRAPFEYYERK